MLEDGGEVDLDLGNYERFLDVQLTRHNNITTGKVYRSVIEREVREKKPLLLISGKVTQILLLLIIAEARRLSGQDRPGCAALDERDSGLGGKGFQDSRRRFGPAAGRLHYRGWSKTNERTFKRILVTFVLFSSEERSATSSRRPLSKRCGSSSSVSATKTFS